MVNIDFVPSTAFIFPYNFVQIAPFILTPTAFPRKEFEKAVGLQVTLNELMHWVAHDHQFLEETLEQTIKVDEFTAGLYRIYEKVHADGTNQVIIRGFLFLFSNSRLVWLKHSHLMNNNKAIKYVERVWPQQICVRRHPSSV